MYSRSLRAVVVSGLTLASAVATMVAPNRAAASPKDRIGEIIENVTLRDLDGNEVKLLDYHTGSALVIAYTGLGCPISGRYAPRLEALSKKLSRKGVKFVGINANPHDSADKIAAEVKELGITFPVLRDVDQSLTKQLDAKTTTVAFLVAKNGTIKYRGMIDDQYTIGAQRDKPRNRYLERAIREVLGGKDPFTYRTVAPGCLITRIESGGKGSAVTYSSDIARIVQENCQKCHRPQQIAPFPLTSYASVRGWSAMIHSVLTDGRMPPWNAHSDFDGQFINERKIPDKDKKMLLAWIENGMPRGNPDEEPAKKSWPGLWRIGKPDKVFTMKKAFKCPSEGIVQYQYFSIPTNFKKDMWIQAMELRPGAADVVHHILVFTVDKDGKSDVSRLGLEDGIFAANVPGDLPSVFPEGRGKRIKAGSTIVLQVHYTTNGKSRKDKSKLGLIFADKPVTEEVRSRGIYNLTFKIPAGDPDYEVRADHTFTEDTLLLSFYPHMHFRGKDWRFVAHFPDGTKQTLLFVPNYDYNWQESYVLKDPMLVPKGTKIECIAHYDNSADNFLNPDPTIDVGFGEQSWDEMMFGYMDYIVPTQ